MTSGIFPRRKTSQETQQAIADADGIPALVSMLGGVSNTSSLNHMRHVVRWLGGWCIPEQVAIPGGRAHLSDDDIVDEGLSERLDGVLNSLIEIIGKLGN